MKTLITLKSWVAPVAMVVLSGPAQAALVDRGGGMIYDTTRDITWLADMNYASTSGYTGTGVNPTGTMTVNAATAWAENLVFGGHSDWRLPTLNPADASCSNNFNPGNGFPIQYSGFNCTGGELSGLFVADLGYNNDGSGLITSDDTPEQIANLALFTNIQSGAYWSGTAYAPAAGTRWGFDAFEGSQSFFGFGDFRLFAVAVRPGDVVASVPEPQTLALVLLALGATVARRRRGHVQSPTR